MNSSTVDSTFTDKLKRLVVKVLRFGGKDIQTAEQAAPYGIDSNPIKGMTAIYVEGDRKGNKKIIGYLNTNVIAQPGEVRMYSTDDNGAEQTYMYLLKDGTIEIGGDDDNMVRYSKLEQAFNQLQADHDNLVTLFNAHVHAGVTPGSGSTGTTATPGQPSTADIVPAKIVSIKTLA